MSIKEYKYTICVNCNKKLSSESPPSTESYENGEIHIANGMLLLPKKSLTIKKGVSTNHAISLEGYFCNRKCLNKFIKKALNKKL